MQISRSLADVKLLILVWGVILIQHITHATIYTASGLNCSHQQPLGEITRGGYALSVNASCPQPLPPWDSTRRGPCKPKHNLSPKALGTWYTVGAEWRSLWLLPYNSTYGATNECSLI